MQHDTNAAIFSEPRVRQFTHLEVDSFFEVAGTLDDAKRARQAVLEWAKEHPHAIAKLWLADELHVPETIIRDRLQVWLTPNTRVYEINALEDLLASAVGKHRMTIHWGGSEKV